MFVLFGCPLYLPHHAGHLGGSRTPSWCLQRTNPRVSLDRADHQSQSLMPTRVTALKS